MQPTFNPWIGYFDLIDYVDKFVFLDTVQLTRRSWQVRNKLKVNGKEHMFTLPIVKEKERDREIIHTVKLANPKENGKKIYALLQQSYKKSRYYDEVNAVIKDIVLYETELLSEYNINIIKTLASYLDIETEFVTLSQTDYQLQTSKGKLILDICDYMGTDKYISPLGSKEYLTKVQEQFFGKDIEIYYQYYNHPTYQQIGDEFIPYLGIFDLLYNSGFKKSIEIIKSGRKYEDR
jgi:hypothetical protein